MKTPEDTPNTKAAPQFEGALDELQKLISKLESGQLSLEESLTSFERGVQLAKVCQEHLQQAEKRIEILTKATAGGAAELKPFQPERG